MLPCKTAAQRRAALSPKTAAQRRTAPSPGILASLTPLLVLLLALAGAQPLSAQSEPRQSVFRGYPVLGMNVSQVDGDNLAGFHKVGLHAGAGVFVMLNQARTLSVSMELLFTQKGSRTRPGSFPIDKLVLNYVDLPVQISYHDKDRMIFSGGFSYGNLFGFKRILDGIEQQNDEGLFEPREFGYLVTATFLVQEHIGIGLRYSGSLLSFGEANNPLVSGLTNRAITFRGSYIF